MKAGFTCDLRLSHLKTLPAQSRTAAIGGCASAPRFRRRSASWLRALFGCNGGHSLVCCPGSWHAGRRDGRTAHGSWHHRHAGHSHGHRLVVNSRRTEEVAQLGAPQRGVPQSCYGGGGAWAWDAKDLDMRVVLNNEAPQPAKLPWPWAA